MSALESLFASVPTSASLLNALTIIVGCSIGLTVGRRIPQRISDALVQALGIVVIYNGCTMISTSADPLIMLASFVGGTAIGELLRLDAAFERFGEWAKKKLRMKDERFVAAFVSTSLIYCVGSMAILGSIEQGLGEFPTLLVTKSVMDGTSAVVFSATLGIGVLFSCVPVYIYQAAITLGASSAQELLTPPIVEAMSSAGGLMLACIGLNMIGVTKFRTANQLPALAIASLLAALF